MTTPKIKTHKMKNTYVEDHFFILSKGMNAGKPLDKPCPNCFVLFAKSKVERNMLYWLCFGLWQGNFFHPFLTGYVIPFIRLDIWKLKCKTWIDKNWWFLFWQEKWSNCIFIDNCWNNFSYSKCDNYLYVVCNSRFMFP